MLKWFNPMEEEISWGQKALRSLALLVALYLIIAPFVMVYEYNRTFPDFYDPIPASAKAENAPAGLAYTNSLIGLSEGILQAWLPNDAVYPSVFLDNPQNFQLGELEVIRYGTRVLRDKLSRQRTTDKIDKNCDQAFTYFSNNPELWIFPAAETKFKGGLKALQAYEAGLAKGSSHFYPRADNLIELLDQFSSLLGGVNTRLNNAPRDRGQQLSEETAGDEFMQGESTKQVKVPWLEIDNNFYFARGVAFGLRQILMAVRYEFRGVLELKRSTELFDNIVSDLELAQFEPWFILNGSRGSIFANHSLSLVATLESVRQKIVNMQSMLER